MTRDEALALVPGDALHWGECARVEGSRRTHIQQTWIVTGFPEPSVGDAEFGDGFFVPVKHVGTDIRGDVVGWNIGMLHSARACPVRVVDQIRAFRKAVVIDLNR